MYRRSISLTAYALLSCQVAAMLASTLEDIQKLRHQMYNLKSV